MLMWGADAMQIPNNSVVISLYLQSGEKIGCSMSKFFGGHSQYQICQVDNFNTLVTGHKGCQIEWNVTVMENFSKDVFNINSTYSA